MTFPYGKGLLYQEDFMKKKFLFGLIALLSVSFIFFGCGDSGGGGGGLGGAFEEEAAALATELETDLSFTGVTYNSAGEVFLNEGGAITGGKTLAVPANLALVLPAGQPLTVAATGKIEVAAGGAFTIAETATLTGDAAGATIVIAAGVTVTGGTNFYDAEGEPLSTVAAGTIYIWDEDADGDGTDGWKAQAPVKVTAGAITGVTAPETGETAATIVTATAEYSGTVTWAPALVAGKFAAETVYTATITLLPETGYTFAGFSGPFTVAGVDTSYSEDDFTAGLKQSASGTNWVVTAIFEATEAEAEPDELAPVPGDDGVLAASAVTATGFTVSWTAATDEGGSAAEDLKYFVYTHTEAFSANTVDTIIAEGALFNTGGTAGITTLAITGLNASTTYYFAVIVADEEGNKDAYTSGSQATTAAPTASVAGNNIAGTSDVILTPVDLTITISHDKIAEQIDQGTSLAGWITNRPNGLTAVAKEDILAEATSVVITIAGTPESGSDQLVGITIPANTLTTTGAATLSVTNESVVFQIGWSAARNLARELESAGVANATVIDDANVKLTESGITTTKVTIPDTVTLDLDDYNITVGSSLELVIEDPSKIKGDEGVIIATIGTITINEVAGYTTETGGVVPGDLDDAVTALAADVAKLVNSDQIDLQATFFASNTGVNHYGIGSVTLADDTATTVLNDASGSGGSSITLATAFKEAVTAIGSDVIGTNADNIKAATFTLTIDTVLQLTDSDGYSGGDKFGIVTFSGVKLTDSDLITAELASFSIGVATGRE
jgi:hypothetical protein